MRDFKINFFLTTSQSSKFHGSEMFDGLDDELENTKYSVDDIVFPMFSYDFENNDNIPDVEIREELEENVLDLLDREVQESGPIIKEMTQLSTENVVNSTPEGKHHTDTITVGSGMFNPDNPAEAIITIHTDEMKEFIISIKQQEEE